MKLLLVFALLALAFTTGFTCSKNTPTSEAPTGQASPQTSKQETEPSADPHEQMAAPPLPSGSPAEAGPAAGSNGAQATSTPPGAQAPNVSGVEAPNTSGVDEPKSNETENPDDTEQDFHN